jgi:hypothetical protein
MPMWSSSRGGRNRAMRRWSNRRNMCTGTFRLRPSGVAVDRQLDEAKFVAMTHRVTNLCYKRRRDRGLERETSTEHRSPAHEHSGTVRKGLNEAAGDRNHRADE